MKTAKTYPLTPDEKYFVVNGRLWRATDPHLDRACRAALVAELMSARRRVGLGLRSGDAPAVAAARSAVDIAKRGLGERGPVWWSDGAPDLNRHLVINTPYRAWYEALLSQT